MSQTLYLLESPQSFRCCSCSCIAMLSVCIYPCCLELFVSHGVIHSWPPTVELTYFLFFIRCTIEAIARIQLCKIRICICVLERTITVYPTYSIPRKKESLLNTDLILLTRISPSCLRSRCLSFKAFSMTLRIPSSCIPFTLKSFPHGDRIKPSICRFSLD